MFPFVAIIMRAGTLSGVPSASCVCPTYQDAVAWARANKVSGCLTYIGQLHAINRKESGTDGTRP